MTCCKVLIWRELSTPWLPPGAIKAFGMATAAQRKAFLPLLLFKVRP